MYRVLYSLLMCILTISNDSKKTAPIRTTAHTPPPKDSIMMDWMLDDVKTNASIIHQGGQAQIIFTCSKQIKSCTRPPNQTQIRISQDHAVDDRTDVQATWKNGILEMKITFSEDLPFGEFTCLCNGKNMIYHYLYRLCTMEEVIQHEASFQPSINQSCFSMLDPSTKKVIFGYKLSKKACDEGHLYPASRKSKNYVNHTICDGSSSFTLCHSIYKDHNDKVPRKTPRINVVTTEKDLCTKTHEGFPLYSILYVSSLVNPATSCDSILESPLKQYLEPIDLESPVRITSERTKFCFVAPKTDKKNTIFINLTVSKKIRKTNVQLWEQISHASGARLYDIDIEKKIDRVLQMDAIKVECRRTKNAVPFTRSVVRLIFMNISIVPVIKASQGESCGGLRNLNCRLKLSESSKVRFGFEWTLNGSVTSERIDGSHQTGDDLHLYRGPGIYKCHVRLPLVYPLQFNMKYGAPLVELVSAPFKVQYKCLSKQILEQLHHFQLEAVDLKRSDFALHLALALGAIIFCSTLAGVCLLLATKTHAFDKLFGSKSRKSTTADTDIGTFDRGASILSNVKESRSKKKSKS